MKTALAMYGFDRPHYLSRCIRALEKAESKDGIDFYYFQDGAVNSVSGRRWADDAMIEQCTEIARKSSLNFNVTVAPTNNSIAIQQMTSSRWLFEDLKYNSIIGLVDDFEVAKSFLHVRKVLINQFRHDPKIFCVQHGYLNHMTAEQKRGLLDKYVLSRNMAPPGGWTIFRNKWLRLLALYKPYYDMISVLDYRLRPHEKIKNLIGTRVTSHDAAYEWALYKTDMYNVWPVVNRCRDIGEQGVHKRPHLHGKHLRKTSLDEFPEDLAITEFKHDPACLKKVKWAGCLRDRK
jgi:hypothetical protein